MSEPPDALNIQRSQGRHDGNDAPLVGVYPFGGSDEPITLWDGMARASSSGDQSDPCRVHMVLNWKDGAHIDWSADYRGAKDPNEHLWEPGGSDERRILLGTVGEDYPVAVRVTGYGTGYANRVDFGGKESLTRVVVHWINLPHIDRGKRLAQAKDGIEWMGRIDLNLGDWCVRLDARSDLDVMHMELKRRRAFAMTHVMELTKRDGSDFSNGSAETVLEALQWGMGYALGRRVAPVLPVGFDMKGKAVWSSWEPRNAEHPGRGSLSWWQQNRLADLEGYLQALVSVWTASAEGRTLWRYLLSYATTTSDGTYTELRTILAVATLERLSWIREVGMERVSSTEWKKLEAHQKIRRLLNDCNADISLQPKTEALNRYAEAKGKTDGPAAIVEVRNRIVHFKNGAEMIIDREVLADSARLASRYLDFVILHHLGYQGAMRNRMNLGGVSSATEPAPWTV